MYQASFETGAELPRRCGPEDIGLGLCRWRWWPAEGRLDWPDTVLAFLDEGLESAAGWEAWLKHVHPQDRQAVQRSLLAETPSLRLTYRLLRNDGHIVWIADRRCREEDGSWSGVFIDISDSVRTAAGESEAQYRANRVMAAAGIGIVFRDFQTGAEFCNDTLFALMGAKASAAPPSYDQLSGFVHPDDTALFHRTVAERRRQGGHFDLDYRITTPHGEVRWVRERGQYERSASGEVVRYYGAVRDITAEKRRAAELNASRLRLKMALEANNMAVWEYSPKTEHPSWSDEYYRLLGYEPRSVPAARQNWLAVVHPDDRVWVADAMNEMLESGAVSELTYRILADGRERWVRDSWSWARSSAGDGLVCHGLSADITEWKLRENRLIAAENWLKLAVEAADLGIWEQDLETMEYLWNDHVPQLLGFEPGEMQPSSDAWYAHMHPDDIPAVKARVKAARETLADFTLEYRLILPGNIERWVEERGRVSLKGGSARHHGVMFDISARKALELRLRESRKRLQLALDTGEMGFWTGDEHNADWDERIYRIQGYEPFSVVPSDESFMRVLHPDDREYVKSMEEKAKATGDTVALEFRIIRPDGELRWIESRFRSTESRPFGRYGIMLDITERKSREDYYLRSQRLEAAGQLLGGMVHDFNNLLAVIAATLERVERNSTSPEMARQLAEAREAALAGALFNRRLINISQLRRQQPQPIWIGERIAAIMGTLTAVMKPGIAVSSDFAADLWPVLVDPLDLESAVINLLINARDAIEGEGRILISAHNGSVPPGAGPEGRPAGDYVVLTISDTGCGMDRTTLGRATEPFFSTKPEGAGTGLGLTSVAAFASSSRGFMQIESAPGQGTAISISIPRATATRTAGAEPSGMLPMGDGELVLVVDDDAAVRESTMQRVEALGYAVDEAASGRGAIARLTAGGPIALVLSDIAMPGDLNGFGLRAWIAAEIPHVPVILFSAQEHLLRHGEWAAGQGEVLAKSCSRQQLAEALARAMAVQPEEGADLPL